MRNNLGQELDSVDFLNAAPKLHGFEHRGSCLVEYLIGVDYTWIMAFSNPQVYIDELASPVCRRFEAEPSAYDLAISSCIILYHFADVVAHVRSSTPHAIAEEIAALDNVSEVYSVTGTYDLVALVRVARHDDLADIIPGRISKIPGVEVTDTHVAFRTYSQHDLEAAFAIGLDA